MVFISNPGQDHIQLKAWRPITLIKCIGKLGEKVVADELQTEELLHKLQFGSLKDRSVIDAIFREIARVKQCLARKGKAGWGLWDVKRGFRNVRMPVVVETMKGSEIGGRWTGWMKSFFRKRIFDIE